MSAPGDLDAQVRGAAFEFLTEATERHGEALPRTMLLQGFTFEGRRIPLISAQQGIFKPAALPDVPLGITTTAPREGRARPYDDHFDSNNLLRYHYRGTDPDHRDNAGLREALARQTPLIYFHGLLPGLYMPAWPVYIVGEERPACCFLAVVDHREALRDSDVPADPVNARRIYLTVETRRRLHQVAFRERVLRAYQERCAVCRLRRRELLEAAHILPDTHPRGEPVVPNGLSLCTLHHAAFDRNLLGIRPDLRIELHPEIRSQKDGPLLVHGLQGFQGLAIHVPRPERLRPDPACLEERFAIFRKAV